MAVSSVCVKCNGTRFETKINTPTGSNYKLIFVQCANCGGVVGAMEYFNVGSLLEQQKQTMDQQAIAIAGLRSAVEQMAHALRNFR